MVQVKHGIKSRFVRTFRQLTLWKEIFRVAEKTAVTKNEPMNKRMIFLIQILRFYVEWIRPTIVSLGCTIRMNGSF